MLLAPHVVRSFASRRRQGGLGKSSRPGIDNAILSASMVPGNGALDLRGTDAHRDGEPSASNGRAERASAARRTSHVRWRYLRKLTAFGGHIRVSESYMRRDVACGSGACRVCATMQTGCVGATWRLSRLTHFHTYCSVRLPLPVTPQSPHP